MRTGLLLALALLVAGTADAHANKLIEPGPRDKIAKGAFSASPEHEWNRLDDREGKYQEIWTVDGDSLNKLTFYGGVPIGEPLFKERDKKNQPLPKVSEGMLITDIPVLLENTYRTLWPGSRIAIGTQHPADFAGSRGIRFTYSLVTNQDEVERLAEAVGAVRNGRLYLITYEAPALYFYDKDVAKFRQVVDSTRIKE